MLALASKITKMCSLRSFFNKNTRATGLFKRDSELDEFRFLFFSECKDH